MFNAEKWITKTLNSVINQTMQSWECLVIDDGSTDESNEKVVALALKDPRIILIKLRNSGPANARNVGMYEASGRYIAFLDSDDIWLPSKLEKQICALKNSPEAAFTLCDHFLFQENPRKILGAVYLRDLNRTMNGWINFWGEGPAASSTLILDSFKIGDKLNFRNDLFTTADFEFMLRLHNEYKYVGTHEILAGYRQHRYQMHADILLVEKEIIILNELFTKTSSLAMTYSKSSTNYLKSINILRGSQPIVIKVAKIFSDSQSFFLTLKLVRKKLFRKLNLMRLLFTPKILKDLIALSSGSLETDI